MLELGILSGQPMSKLLTDILIPSAVGLKSMIYVSSHLCVLGAANAGSKIKQRMPQFHGYDQICSILKKYIHSKDVMSILLTAKMMAENIPNFFKGHFYELRRLN